MIETDKLKWWHLERIEPQASQDGELTAGAKAHLCRAGGWTVLDGPTVIGIFSLNEIAPGRVIAFTILSKHMQPRHLKFLARIAREWLYGWGRFRRVEAYVLEDAEDEQQWCERVLGLQCEARLRQFTIDGRDCYIYSHVTEV